MKLQALTKILGASVLATLMLGATVPSMAASQSVTNVIFWDFLTGGDGSTMDQVVAEFNKTHPTIHIDHVTEGWGSDYATKVIANILGNHGPDIAMAHADEALRWENKGVLIPWDSAVASAGMKWSDFSAQSLQDSVINGKHYYLPLDVNGFVMFYNKSLLQKDHLLSNNGRLAVKNYADFVHILTTVKKDGQIPFAYPENGINPLALWYMFYQQMGGGPILNPTNTQVNFMTASNKPKAIAALQDVYDLYNKDQVIPKNMSNSISLFQAGKAAITIDGTWNVNFLASTMGKSFGVTSIPAFFGSKPYAYTNAHVVLLPNNPERTPAQMKAAMVFLKWFSQYEWIWAKSGNIPADKAAVENVKYKMLPYQKYYDSELRFAKFWPATKSVWFVNDSEVNNIVQGILLGKASVSAGIEQMATTINSQLSQGY